MNFLNIVIPCHNEEKNINPLFDKLTKCLEEMEKTTPLNTAVIFVDDGSSDQTLQCIKRIKGMPNIKIQYISFTKNFGKEAAIMAGLKKASANIKGGYTVIMDADMQDPPELLKEMFHILNHNPDVECVGARRVTRKGEPVIRSFFAKLFYKVYNRIANVNLLDGARDFCMMRWEMLNTITELPEVTRFSKGLFSWSGYRTYYLEYENTSRENGKSKWSLGGLVGYAVNGLVSFSSRPLEAAALMGISTCFVSVIFMMYLIFQKIYYNVMIQGYALLVCLILLMGGLQLLFMGILGEYISKIFIETKKRPLYIIREQGEKQDDI